MSRIRSTMTTIIILSLGFAATGSASAFALHRASRIAAPHAYHVHSKARSIAGHRLAHYGYAGPAPYSDPVAAWTGARFVPGHGIVGESCDLPTSACSNDERVTK